MEEHHNKVLSHQDQDQEDNSHRVDPDQQVARHQDRLPDEEESSRM
jgi:hypothetical protein